MTGPNLHFPFDEEDLSKGERTRLEIMQAALGLFSAQGYHGTSMRQIAERAGIALGGIYNHFGSKEDIFTAITVDFHPIHSILPALEAAQGETVEEVVQQSAEQMYATLNQRQDFLNLMLIEVVEFKGQHFPALFAQIFPRALQFSKRLKQKKGPLRQDLPLPVMVVTFLGMMFSFFLFQRVFGSLVQLGPPKQLLRQVIDIYLHGVIGPDPEGGAA